jgi:hypothetical protein
MLVKEITMSMRQEFGSGLPTFDVFRGHYQEADPVWIESVQGLGEARERMKQIATETLGAYFVFSVGDQLVLDIMDTERELKRANLRAAKSGVA